MTACSKLDQTPRSRKSKPPSYPGRMQHCMAHGLCHSCQVRHNIANKEDLAPVFVARTTLARVRAAVMAVSSRCFSSFFSALISLRKWLRSPLSWAFLVFACKIKKNRDQTGLCSASQMTKAVKFNTIPLCTPWSLAYQNQLHKTLVSLPSPCQQVPSAISTA